MAKKIKCNHVLGYFEYDGYDGAVNTNFVHIDFSDLDDAKKLQSNDGSIYNFCPTCGKKLEGFLDKRISEIQEMIKKIQEEKKAEEDKKKRLFDQSMIKTAKETKLDQLPNEGYFIVICNPTKNSYGKDIAIHGTKDDILRNCTSQMNRFDPDLLVVKTIHIVCDQNVFQKAITDGGWNPDPKIPNYFIKKDGNNEFQISMDKGGIVWITKKHTDSDGDVNTSYDRMYFFNFRESFKVDIPLKFFNLV